MNTTAMVLTVLVAFGITAALGIVLIPFLHRLKFGQTILDIGPSWHKKKQGTPTMGGIMFILGVTIAIVVGYLTMAFMDPSLFNDTINNLKLFSAVVMALAYGALGFLDDYIKVVKKQNEGLTARQKYLMQLIISVFYLVMLYMAGDSSTVVIIPFLGQLDMGLLYYPLAIIIITGFVNAVNLTDGIDGLASSVTFIAALIFMIIAGVLKFPQSVLLSCALAGGCLGFLIWNFYPAKVFMGDTGSLFLGGIVVALAFNIGLPLLLLFIGIVYLCEAFSVILQVISFKTTGKRIFKMSPIHHHFEMSGWSEVQIVITFSFVGLLGGIAAILSVMFL